MKWYQRFGVKVALVSGFWLSIVFFVTIAPLFGPHSQHPASLGIPDYKEIGIAFLITAIILLQLFLCIIFWFKRQYQTMQVLTISSLLVGIIGSGICGQTRSIKSYKEQQQRENWYKEHPTGQ